MTDTSDPGLLFRIGTAERQLENMEAPDDVLDRIANDIDAVTDEHYPHMATEGPERCAD